MIISYNWLSEYLPIKIEPDKLSRILTAIGLEVESLHKYESVKGGLAGLVTGEVISCEKHPDADKLKITTVDTGDTEILQIVCGADNVAKGQKVIVAPVGTTIYPNGAEPILIKKAKIRGVESQGMICAEDEIGLGNSHAGIMVLPPETPPGKKVAGLFHSEEDFIIEIGLTPNRMDAMSHLGVARDVCAYLSHHEQKGTQVKSPFKNSFKPDNNSLEIEVSIENTEACRRYSGQVITGIGVAESPSWLQQKLKVIGLKPINNIVDITNFILHETGQPLHAFDADRITGKKIIIKNAKAGATFKTLDNKERKLLAQDLLICNSTEAMCLAGVYGGAESGVTNSTTNVFIESAWFDPQTIRKTSVKHGLRTDAAARFEKGVDISNTVNVLKRAVSMIKEICGGSFSGNMIDIYPVPVEQKTVGLKYHYLKKLSGKNYHGDSVKNILTALGFVIAKDNIDELWVNVPLSKPDIQIAADIVEEVMRIDGLDNIEIPSTISIAPSVNSHAGNTALKEKLANYLAGLGFYEIFTNSITNSKYYKDETGEHFVKMINSLSADLDIMRPQMLQTGLEVISHNINRKTPDLMLFEIGKTYHSEAVGSYTENRHLALYLTGKLPGGGWQSKTVKADFYMAKGVVENLFRAAGIDKYSFVPASLPSVNPGMNIMIHNKPAGFIGEVKQDILSSFSIKEPVFYADINWDEVLQASQNKTIRYKEVSKFPSVERDLALIVDRTTSYQEIEEIVKQAKIPELQPVRLFDIFESEKLGANKKSMAVNFTFLDETKTLTDKEIDTWMNKLIQAFEKNLGAEIRK